MRKICLSSNMRGVQRYSKITILQLTLLILSLPSSTDFQEESESMFLPLRTYKDADAVWNPSTRSTDSL
jgi:hypothetical protein